MSGQKPKVKPEFNLLRIHISSQFKRQRRPLTYNRFQRNISNAFFFYFMLIQPILILFGPVKVKLGLVLKPKYGQTTVKLCLSTVSVLSTVILNVILIN